jgi:hypothetical protein
MLEVHLRSGQVVAFDGRVVEVFAPAAPSRRFHLEQLGSLDATEEPDGGRSVPLEDGVTLAFAREEAPACTRFLTAVASARDASARVG